MSDAFEQLFIDETVPPSDEHQLLFDLLQPYVKLEGTVVHWLPAWKRLDAKQRIFVRLLVQRVFTLKLSADEWISTPDLVDSLRMPRNTVAPKLSELYQLRLVDKDSETTRPVSWRVRLGSRWNWREFLTSQ